MPGLALGDVIPNIEADSTQGPIKLHDFIDESWTIIFSHPGKLGFDYEIAVSLFDLTVSSANSLNLVCIMMSFEVPC
jgi:alkyl hydroperoxide reductase subunit AhpC